MAHNHTCWCSARMSRCTRRRWASWRRCKYTLLSMSRACLGLKARVLLLAVLLRLPLRLLRLLLWRLVLVRLPDLRLDLQKLATTQLHQNTPSLHGASPAALLTVQVAVQQGDKVQRQHTCIQ